MIVKDRLLETEEKNKEFLKNLCLSLLQEGKDVYMYASGMSMYPFVKNGDRLKIVSTSEAGIKIGDLIAVDRRDRDGAWVFVHRVVKIVRHTRKSIYFTKGDFHKKGLDSPIAIESIAGKIIRIQRGNLELNLELPLWRRLNNVIAKMSLKYPHLLHFLSRYINLIVEWRLFLFKVKNRLKKGNPLLYNTEELLLICARSNLNEELKKKAVDLIREGLDWERFCEIGIGCGASILAYNALRSIVHRVRIPQSVLDRLKSAYLFTVLKTASQHKECLEILKLFAKHDIPALPLKGTFLSERLYGDIATRGVSIDFDLLLKEKDKKQASNLLEDSGYGFAPSAELEIWEWQRNFIKQETIIDIHWDITMTLRTKERIEGFWSGARCIGGDGILYYEFKDEELLLYLCTRAVFDNTLLNLRDICDINQFLDKYSYILEWDAIIEKAKKWKLSSSLYAAILLCKKMFNPQLPVDVLNKIKPSWPKRFFIELFANKKIVLRDCKRRSFMHISLGYVFFELVEAGTFSEYSNIIFKRILFPPREAMGNKSYIFRFANNLLKLLVKFMRHIFI